ncbi:MAG: phenazine biosynthesis protein, partial [Streptococcus vestibularis]|nr:phenazine biosynthesis protein [Streptococcus vestibularis]
SERSGLLLCRIEGDRIYLAGKASLYSRGEIYIMD